MVARARSTAPADVDARVAQLTEQLETSALTPRDPAWHMRGDSALLVQPIDRVVPGRPIQLAFLARRPDSVRAAWLYARPSGAAGYSRSELVRDGDAYLRGTIEGALVRGERVDWYVEIASGDGEAEAVLGSQAQPNAIAIDRVVTEAPIEANRTHIDGHVDYVDFDGKFNEGYDQYYQAGSAPSRDAAAPRT
jgi:hypothetical protein